MPSDATDRDPGYDLAASACCRPAQISMAVVLPAPFGPGSPVMRPDATVRSSRPARAWRRRTWSRPAARWQVRERARIQCRCGIGVPFRGGDGHSRWMWRGSRRTRLARPSIRQQWCVKIPSEASRRVAGSLLSDGPATAPRTRRAARHDACRGAASPRLARSVKGSSRPGRPRSAPTPVRGRGRPRGCTR